MFISNWVRRVPIYGELASARRENLIAALAELSATVLFSTLPIWLFPAIFSLFITDAPTFGDLLSYAVMQGDFYLYAAACVGPLIYIIFKKYAEIRPIDAPDERASDYTFGTRIGRLTFEFPYGVIFVTISVLLCTISALLYTFITMSKFPQSPFATNASALMVAAIVLYIFSLSCLYAASVYRLELESVGKKLPDQEREFLEKWGARND